MNEDKDTKKLNTDVDSKSEDTTKSVSQDLVKMTIDQDICIRCGSCHITYPDVFEGHSDGTSHPIEGVKVERNLALEMKLICPVEAIDLEEIKV
jgi:ferredoxin